MRKAVAKFFNGASATFYALAAIQALAMLFLEASSSYGWLGALLAVALLVGTGLVVLLPIIGWWFLPSVDMWWFMGLLVTGWGAGWIAARVGPYTETEATRRAAAMNQFARETEADYAEEAKKLMNQVERLEWEKRHVTRHLHGPARVCADAIRRHRSRSEDCRGEM